ncbi:MAG TPA: hypothetical protein VGN01_04110 [Acidobacteriaceae bacterium]
MRVWISVAVAVAGLNWAPTAVASSVERVRNEKVVVTEDTLAPGESEALPVARPSVVVYMSGGNVVTTMSGRPHAEKVKEGETVFQAAGKGALKNGGSSALHFTRIEFLGAGRQETWGMGGLSPHYVMLLENQYVRAYDIKIPAQTFEPQHTHHDRVVVCLSGAELEHILPDGSKQPSTLKTGEVGWRLAATHTGHNFGHTNLWVIAVEPK